MGEKDRAPWDTGGGGPSPSKPRVGRREAMAGVLGRDNLDVRGSRSGDRTGAGGGTRSSFGHRRQLATTTQRRFANECASPELGVLRSRGADERVRWWGQHSTGLRQGGRRGYQGVRGAPREQASTER